MTELEKKQSGQIYDARDPELRERYHYAKNMARIYNQIPSENMEEKNRILRLMIGNCGENTRVNQPFYVDYGSNISIGDNTMLNINCTLQDTGEIRIGSHTLIGPDVKIYTAVHEIEAGERFWELEDGVSAIKTRAIPVAIGDYVWIGGGSIILPGVTIGDYAIIGAGSVVTSSIQAHAVAYGNPCRVSRIQEEKQ